MAKEYVFAFSGTKEDFLNRLDQRANRPYRSYCKNPYYYFDDYLVEIEDDRIRFGVQKAGHSGGYWFVPTMTESNGITEFRGKIQSPESDDNRKPIIKAIDSIGIYLLLIIVLPIFLVFWLYVLLRKLILKICNRPVPKEKTTEESLYDLMENYFGCVAIGDCIDNRR